MTDTDYTHITVLLDRSGSMERIRDDMQGALDRFVADQAKEPGRATISAYLFDDQYDRTLHMVDLADAPEIRLEPRGMTALLDSWCRAIDDTGDTLAALAEAERPGTVLFVVITDGHENASREFTKADVNDRVARQRDGYGWDFVFLGANQDAVAEAQSYGIGGQSAMTFAATDHGTQAVASSLSSYTTRTRQYGAGTQAFDDDDRKAAMDDEDAITPS